MPYTFLETVARKYVTINNCKKIMVDMKEELKLAQDKIAEEKVVNVRAPRAVNTDTSKGKKICLLLSNLTIERELVVRIQTH